jgi:hypothetical protein
MSAMNKVRFQQFLKQAKGLRLHEVHVRRINKKSVILQYNGRASKGKSRLTGEWAIARGERDESAINEDINSFLGQLRKHFFVKRGEGLEDAVFGDEAMEAKATPIISTTDESAS